jgi:hypothetical protein
MLLNTLPNRAREPVLTFEGPRPSMITRKYTTLSATTTVLLLASLSALALPAHWALAQSSPPAPAKAPTINETPRTDQAELANTYDLDTLYILTSPEVDARSIDDNIWTIAAGSGKKLIQIPIKITNIQKDTKFDASVFKLRGGTFVCYRMGSIADRGPAGGSAADKQYEGTMPQDTPWVAKSFIVKKNGKISWPMERTIISGSVKEQDKLYSYKLSPTFFQKKQPEPVKVTKIQGESTATFYARQTEESTKFNNASKEYRELSKQVRELPTEFEADVPNRIWLVFDIGASTREFNLDGPSPLPWTLTFDQFNAIRDAVLRPIPPEKDAGGNYRFKSDLTNQISIYSAIITANPEQPFNARAAAYALSLLKLAGYMKTGDPIFNLYVQILASKDSSATNAAVKDLASTFPPTQATAALIARAGSLLNSETRIAIFKNSISNVTDATVASVGRESVDRLNSTIASADSKTASNFLDEVFNSVKNTPLLVQPLVAGVQFEALPDKRLEEVIIKIVERAPTDKLALGWLNNRLLGSVDQKVQRKTLEVINSADVGNRMLNQVADKGLSAVFGKPASQAEQRTLAIRLEAPIPILTPNDAIFRVLQAGDPKIRTLAWDALPRFAVTAVAPGDPKESAGDEAAQRAKMELVYRQLQEITFSQNPTPTQIVDFMVKQDNPSITVFMLGNVILKGSEKASIAATKAIMNSKGTYPMDAYMMSLSYGDRQGLAKHIYENRTGLDPLVTPLMKQRIENNPIVAWFGREVARGVLPAPKDWAGQYQDENMLLAATVSQENDLAMAATAALVLHAGGDERVIRDLNGKFRLSPDQSPAALKAVWLEGKRTINANKLANVAGNYKLLLKVGGSTPKVEDPPTPPYQDIDLGVVNIQVNGTDVTLATKNLTLSSLDIYAIGLENPSELKNFKNDAVSKLPNLEAATKAIDLIGQPNGSFVGKFPLGNNQDVQVTLVPTGQ